MLPLLYLPLLYLPWLSLLLVVVAFVVAALCCICWSSTDYGQLLPAGTLTPWHCLCCCLQVLSSPVEDPPVLLNCLQALAVVSAHCELTLHAKNTTTLSFPCFVNHMQRHNPQLLMLA